MNLLALPLLSILSPTVDPAERSLGGELGVDTDDSAAMHYIGAKYSQRWLYQLPMSIISTSCEIVYTTKEWKTGLGRDKQEILRHYP